MMYVESLIYLNFCYVSMKVFSVHARIGVEYDNNHDEENED